MWWRLRDTINPGIVGPPITWPLQNWKGLGRPHKVKQLNRSINNAEKLQDAIKYWHIVTTSYSPNADPIANQTHYIGQGNLTNGSKGFLDVKPQAHFPGGHDSMMIFLRSIHNLHVHMHLTYPQQYTQTQACTDIMPTGPSLFFHIHKLPLSVYSSTN